MNLLLAALLVLELPLGPGSESAARDLASPHQHAQAIGAGPWFLWDIRVQPQELAYVIALPHAAPAALVRVDLSAVEPSGEAAAETVTVQGVAGGAVADPAAEAAAQAVAETIRARFRQGTVAVRWRAPPPSEAPLELDSGVRQPGSPGAGTSDGRPAHGEASDGAPSSSGTRGDPALGSEATHAPDPAGPRQGGTPRWLALALLGALLTLLIGTTRRWLAPLREGTTPGWWTAVACITGAQAAVLFGLDDVVLHPNAHGWDLVRVLTGDALSPFPVYERYGTVHIELARWLGAAAPRGHETFLASRVACIAATPVVFAWGVVALGAPRAALIAAGLVASAPALLFAGRGETVTAEAVLLAVVTAWVSATAARRRDLGLLAVAAVAAGCLASFRLMGPVLAPAAAAFALLGPAAGQSSPRRWGLALLGAAALGVSLAAPHLVQMGTMMAAELAARPHSAEVPATLLTSPMFTPAILPVAAAAGVAALAGERRLTAALLGLWVLLALVGPAASSGWYQDQARYQSLAVPAVCLAAGWAVHLLCALPARRLGLAGAVLALLALLPDQHLAGRVMATDQAEAQQLRAWRALATDLPAGAWVIVPVRTRSRARTSLPDTELTSARPDVRVVSLQEVLPRPGRPAPPGRPLFWFEPLSCSARYPQEPADAATDCAAAHRELILEPVRVQAVDAELDEELASALRARSIPVLSPTRGDPGQWNPRPFHSAAPTGPGLRIGLYSVAGFAGSPPAGSAAAGSAAAGSAAAGSAAAGSAAAGSAAAGSAAAGSAAAGSAAAGGDSAPGAASSTGGAAPARP